VERQNFQRAAKAAGLTLAGWLRQVAALNASSIKPRPANFDYADTVELSTEAEANPRRFIQKKLEAKRELYR
jgi:hypothetical protein